MSARKRFRLTDAEREAAHAFLVTHVIREGPPPLNGYRFPGISREQHRQSYQSWAKAGHAWSQLGGGTAVMAALCWYQHVHRPGSREWRPSIICRALLDAATPPAPSRRSDQGAR